MYTSIVLWLETIRIPRAGRRTELMYGTTGCHFNMSMNFEIRQQQNNTYFAIFRFLVKLFQTNNKIL